MLGGHLHTFGPVYVASTILILSYNAIQRFFKRSKRTQDIICKKRTQDMISTLPDQLLVKILLFLPTQEAVATVILSKRWQSIWTMLPQLVYKDSEYMKKRKSFLFQPSIWWFLDQSLKLHKAPVLDRLVLELGITCPADADDLRTCLDNVVKRRVGHLKFELNWLSEPLSLPESLYVSYTLVSLTLSYTIFVDVPCMVWLPCLEYLCLVSLEYKDEDAFVRLLSGCPVLKKLYVRRRSTDNLRHVKVKVPSLKTLFYDYKEKKHQEVYVRGSLVIDCTALRKIFLDDESRSSYSIENEPSLEKARLKIFGDNDDQFWGSLSSVRFLNIRLSAATVACCNTISFSQLTECKISPCNLDWLGPFMCFLENSPNLTLLLIDQKCFKHEHFPLSFNSPSFVPECLSNRLEVFEWEGYGGRNGEKEVVRYILANSKCLKRAGIYVEPTWSDEDRKKVRKEFKSMSRFSTSSQLLFSTQLEFDIPFQEEFTEY